MRNVHILIVEDRSATLPYLEKTLESAGFAVTAQSGAQNALHHLDDAHWELIVIDGAFPGQSGANFVAEIRKKLPSTPILILSEQPTKILKEEMKRARLEHLIEKPFAFQEFIAKIEEIIPKAIEKNDELSLDNLVVDVKNTVARRNGKTIVLTKKEFALLSYLMKHKDHAVERAALLEHVWGMQIDPLSNTIEAHILSLRHKIDTDGQTKLIHTVPKFGYRMSVHK